jgi:hypothetical protein
MCKNLGTLWLKYFVYEACVYKLLSALKCYLGGHRHKNIRDVEIANTVTSGSSGN